MQYDIYHAQRMEGELAATLQKHLARIGHIQLADNPGRNEPGTGEINYPFLFAHLDRIGYDGWIGCEYKPADDHRGGPGLAPANGAIGRRARPDAQWPCTTCIATATARPQPIQAICASVSRKGRRRCNCGSRSATAT